MTHLEISQQLIKMSQWLIKISVHMTQRHISKTLNILIRYWDILMSPWDISRCVIGMILNISMIWDSEDVSVSHVDTYWDGNPRKSQTIHVFYIPSALFTYLQPSLPICRPICSRQYTSFTYHQPSLPICSWFFGPYIQHTLYTDTYVCIYVSTRICIYTHEKRECERAAAHGGEGMGSNKKNVQSSKPNDASVLPKPLVWPPPS